MPGGVRGGHRPSNRTAVTVASVARDDGVRFGGGYRDPPDYPLKSKDSSAIPRAPDGTGAADRGAAF